MGLARFAGRRPMVAVGILAATVLTAAAAGAPRAAGQEHAEQEEPTEHAEHAEHAEPREHDGPEEHGGPDEHGPDEHASPDEHGHAGPSADPADPAEGLLPPGDWTPEQVAFAADLVRRTEEALPRFADVNALPAQRFGEFGFTAPGGYDHWGRLEWWADGRVLDPEHPETLVFRRTGDGRREVVAAMFLLEPGTTMANIAERYPEFAWLPGWHVHDDEFCINEVAQFTGPIGDDGACAAGVPAVSPPMVHVWIADNPCGHRFAGLGLEGLECDPHHRPPARRARPATPPVPVAPRFTG